MSDGPGVQAANGPLAEGAIVAVRDLAKQFPRLKGFTRRVIGTVRAVDGVSFQIAGGETLALVGESGSGKTTTGRCILRAIEPTSGEVWYRTAAGDVVDMRALEPGELNRVRQEMGMVFQDPYSSLCPRMRVVNTVGEALANRKLVGSRAELEGRVAALMEKVHLEPGYMRRYPHAFSGGQRQRIAIARALALTPRFVVSDEPVSALDVSVQAQILNLLEELQGEFGITYLVIAHNLAVVEYISDRVAVMYLGRIVELSSTANVFQEPRHPYTEALLSAVPSIDRSARRRRIVLPGDIADPANPPPGCPFHPRCQYAEAVCRERYPALANLGSDAEPHLVACHRAEELALQGVVPPPAQ